MAVRRSMWDALDGFDPQLPAGWEDTEICWRAWLRGWKSAYVSDAVCWHHVGGSSTSPKGARFRLRGACIGRLLFSTKHLPLEDVLLAWSVEAAGAIGDVLSGDFGRGRERILLIGSCVRALPEWIAERRRLYGETASSSRAMVRLMRSIASHGRMDKSHAGADV